MTKPTLIAAEQAAEALGLDVYDLGHQLRLAAEAAVLRAADEVRRGYGLNVGKARRLLFAAEACEAVVLEQMDTEEELAADAKGAGE